MVTFWGHEVCSTFCDHVLFKFSEVVDNFVYKLLSEEGEIQVVY